MHEEVSAWRARILLRINSSNRNWSTIELLCSTVVCWDEAMPLCDWVWHDYFLNMCVWWRGYMVHEVSVESWNISRRISNESSRDSPTSLRFRFSFLIVSLAYIWRSVLSTNSLKTIGLLICIWNRLPISLHIIWECVWYTIQTNCHDDITIGDKGNCFATAIMHIKGTRLQTIEWVSKPQSQRGDHLLLLW